MKKLFFTLSLIGLSMISFTSCEEDEDITTPVVIPPPPPPPPLPGDCLCGYVLSGELLNGDSIGWSHIDLKNICSNEILTISVQSIYDSTTFNGHKICMDNRW